MPGSPNSFYGLTDRGPNVDGPHATKVEPLPDSPFDATLPAEFANRVPNKGMEGLTVTPDGRTLVGVMQSALQQRDLTAKPGTVTTLRIVTVNLRTRATHEYLYLLDNPKDTGTAVSEITALSPTTFLVDERDGAFPPAAYKKLWKIDLTGATDIGPSAPYTLHAKVSPTTNKQDDGEFLTIDTSKLPAVTSKATVTITVR